MPAADHPEAVGMMHVGAALAQGNILLTRIDQPGVDVLLRRRRPHAEHAVLGVKNHLAIDRHVVGDHGGNADAEIDIPTLGNVARSARRHGVARPGFEVCYCVHWKSPQKIGGSP